MPTLFHLIRHGAYPLLDQALGGRADHDLSDLGRTQADRLAARLAQRPIAAVVTSPVRRAQQTAAPIAAGLGLDLAADPAFSEIDFAGWTGRRFADLAADPAWQAWNRFRGSAVVPGGESMLAVQGRAVAGVLRWAAAYPTAELAIVSHADVIKAVLAHVLGAPLDLMRRMEIGPGSLSQVWLAEADAKVLAVNLPP
jgi:probable phosphoglycerate mutase